VRLSFSNKNLQVVEEDAEHVRRPDGLGDVAEGVDSGPSDGLLMRLEKVEEVVGDPHPLLGAHMLRATVRNAPDKVDAVFLHLLVTVAEDRSEAREEVFDWWRHLTHADDVANALQPREDGAERVGVLLPQILVQHDAQVAQELLLAAGLHDDGNAANQLPRLLAHLGRAVIEAPLDGAADLREIRLRPHAQRSDDGAEACMGVRKTRFQNFASN
jgi:hypothetical protein